MLQPNQYAEQDLRNETSSPFLEGKFVSRMLDHGRFLGREYMGRGDYRQVFYKVPEISLISSKFDNLNSAFVSPATGALKFTPSTGSRSLSGGRFFPSEISKYFEKDWLQCQINFSRRRKGEVLDRAVSIGPKTIQGNW